MTSILKVDSLQDSGGNAILSSDGAGTITTAAGLNTAVDTQTLSLFNATGSAPVYACRAWVNFNGQGTLAIRGSGNVSSVTDNGTGDYTINFTTAMPDVNYSFAASSSNNGQGTSDEYTAVSAYGTDSYLAGSLRIGVLRLRFDVQQMYNTTINSVSIFR